jgi:hypothetical protein
MQKQRKGSKTAILYHAYNQHLALSLSLSLYPSINKQPQLTKFEYSPTSKKKEKKLKENRKKNNGQLLLIQVFIFFIIIIIIIIIDNLSIQNPRYTTIAKKCV